uniref:Three finger toxin 4B n=1 Tax=Sistrurus catenatus edwardsii TaxID=8762 RepID=A5X2X0_SISCA|nr:three finger toxin 4B [Sistrurus catenatus edwardsi]
MKTLLVSVGVVAFVYLDSGYSLECHTCKGLLCFDPKPCPEGLDQCFKNVTLSLGLIPVQTFERGCTANCTPNAQTKCCKTNLCNA